MKNYTITVNGNVYEVTVEEGTGFGCGGKTVYGISSQGSI